MTSDSDGAPLMEGVIAHAQRMALVIQVFSLLKKKEGRACWALDAIKEFGERNGMDHPWVGFALAFIREGIAYVKPGDFDWEKLRQFLTEGDGNGS